MRWEQGLQTVAEVPGSSQTELGPHWPGVTLPSAALAASSGGGGVDCPVAACRERRRELEEEVRNLRQLLANRDEAIECFHNSSLVAGAGHREELAALHQQLAVRDQVISDLLSSAPAQPSARREPQPSQGRTLAVEAQPEPEEEAAPQ